jgi:hypothetical protein
MQSNLSGTQSFDCTNSRVRDDGNKAHFCEHEETSVERLTTGSSVDRVLLYEACAIRGHTQIDEAQSWRSWAQSGQLKT